MNDITTQSSEFTRLLTAVLQAPLDIDTATRQQLQNMYVMLTNPTVTLAFGGHFSSGKSTLLNAALRRSLLPTLDLPETGAICILQAGEQDRVELVRQQGREIIPCTTAAIAQNISLRQASGLENEQVHEIKEIIITLSDSPIPPNVHWIDSPGINETPAMLERALEAAGRADLLIWVLNSRQFLSLPEEEFLAEYIAEHGPDSVIFVTNVFLSQDTLADWQAYLGHQIPVHMKKMAYRATEMGFDERHQPLVITVSARAVATLDTYDFGGRDLQLLLNLFRSKDNSRVLHPRFYKAAHTLQAIQKSIQADLAREKERIQAEQSTNTDRQREAERKSRHFLTEADTALTNCLMDWRSGVRSETESISQSITTNTLTRDSSYEERVNDEIGYLTRRAKRTLQSEINRIASENDQYQLDDSEIQQLEQLLTPPSATINVPDTSPSGGSTVAKMAIGATIGSIVPGFGTFVGGLIGAGVGFVSAAASTGAALQKDAEQTKTLISDETEYIIRTVEARRSDIAELIERACIRPFVPAAPDLQKVYRLEKQLIHISTLLQQADALAEGAE